jgi:hypothetical protein
MGLHPVGLLGVGQALVLEVDRAPFGALGEESDVDPGLAVAPIEPSRLRLVEVRSQLSAGEPAIAGRLIHERVEQTLDRDRHRLRGGDHEAVGALADGASAPGALVAHGDRLRAPAVHALLVG